jgi:hypothetical protein
MIEKRVGVCVPHEESERVCVHASKREKKRVSIS